MSQYLTATGIAVSDLDISTQFYTESIGMTVNRTLALDHLVQNILIFEGVRGAAIILIQYIFRLNWCLTHLMSEESSKLFERPVAWCTKKPLNTKIWADRPLALLKTRMAICLS